MMMHGIVMKITEKCIVVLTEDGRFHNLPHPSVLPGLGDKIEVAPKLQIIRNKKNHWLLRKTWGIAASVLLLIGLAFVLQSMQGSTQLVALVAIDINPSIELFVNKKGNVQKVNLINDDARSLLSEKELQGQEFYQAVHLILSKAEEQGYLDAKTEKKWIWVSVAERNASFHVEPEKMIHDGQDYKINMHTANRNQIEKAKGSGLTLNKYVVYEQAKDKGVELNFEDLRTHSIISTLTSAGIDPEQLFDKNPGVLRPTPPQENAGKQSHNEAHPQESSNQNLPIESHNEHSPGKEKEKEKIKEKEKEKEKEKIKEKIKPAKTKQVEKATSDETKPVIESLNTDKEHEYRKSKKDKLSQKQELSGKVQQPSTIVDLLPKPTPRTTTEDEQKSYKKEKEKEKHKEKDK
ncbi:MAG: hypothetical protein H7X86_08595 [Gorillibacterium sp.]|nr:hypothetical protein [Gorillibacterium sp.]